MEQNSDTQQGPPDKSDIESHDHLLTQVRTWLKRKGLKQVELQREMDQMQSNFNAAMTGRNLTLLVQIAQHLVDKHKVDPKQFFPNQKNWRQQMQETVSTLTTVVAENQKKIDLCLTLLQKNVQAVRSLSDSIDSLIKTIKDS